MLEVTSRRGGIDMGLYRKKPVSRSGSPVDRENHDQVGIISPLSARIVQNGQDSLLAAHLEDLPELGLHRAAVRLRQLPPGREQLLRLGLLQTRKVHVFEQPAALEVACQQVVRRPVGTPRCIGNCYALR